MRIIKTRKFSKWAEKSEVGDLSLIDVAKEIQMDIYEVNYGGGIIKKRVSNKGRGKSSSVRTIIAFKKGHHCYFVYGFEKNDKDNITSNEEKALKLLAKSLFSYSEAELNGFIKEGSLIEVQYE